MIRRARSAVSGRFVALADAVRRPRATVVELVDRGRVDDRLIQVRLEVLGEVLPGDVVHAELPANVSLEHVKHVQRELERWVDDNAPGAEVLVTTAELSFTVLRKLEATVDDDVDQALEALELVVAAEKARVPTDSGAGRARVAELERHVDALHAGITELRQVLDGEQDGTEAAAA